MVPTLLLRNILAHGASMLDAKIPKIMKSLLILEYPRTLPNLNGKSSVF